MRKKLALILSLSLWITGLQGSNLGAEEYRVTEQYAVESSARQEGAILDSYEIELDGYAMKDGDDYEEDDKGWISVTTNGETDIPLFWSESTYKNATGEECYMGAIKPLENQKWSENVAFIWHTNGISKDGSLYMTASPDGPRDLKIEYSIDGGKNYKTIGTVTLKADGQVQDVLEDLPPASEFFDIVEYVEGDQVLRVSVASDYKLDGSQGLYESNAGELIFNKIEVISHFISISDPEPVPSCIQVEVYKIADKKAKISWNKVENAKEYKICKRVWPRGVMKYIKTIKADDAKNCSYIVKNLNKNKEYVLGVEVVLENGETDSGLEVLNMKEQIIPKDIKLTKKIQMRKGNKRKVPLTYRKGTDKSWVDKIEYTVKNKKILKIKKNKIVAKKKGTTILKVKVTLKSGLKKVLKTKVVVKKAKKKAEEFPTFNDATVRS